MRIEPITTDLRDSAQSEQSAPYEAPPARLNDSEQEALLLNIDVSLRVHTRAQLFSADGVALSRA